MLPAATVMLTPRPGGNDLRRRPATGNPAGPDVEDPRRHRRRAASLTTSSTSRMRAWRTNFAASTGRDR